MRKSWFRETDLLRIGAIFLLLLILVYPSYSARKEKKEYERIVAELDRLHEENEKEWAEWDLKSNDEKFVWCVWDMNTDAVKDILISDSQNSIYIYVSGVPKNEMPEDSWNKYIEYEKTMAIFAENSNVDKDVYVVGRLQEGCNLWAIDKYGNIIEF